jgi:hypothetical protein
MTIQKAVFAGFAAASLAVLSGCEHGYFEPKAKELSVPAKLTITRDGAGVFDFKYDAPFSDADGNFDFSRDGAAGNVIRWSFTIVDDQGLDLKFKAKGTDAIWIVDKRNVGKDGSPEGPFRGTQFQSFSVSDDGKTLSLTNLNDDGVLYRYGLRFDLGGETVVDDPDAQNGTGGSHGGNN